MNEWIPTVIENEDKKQRQGNNSVAKKKNQILNKNLIASKREREREILMKMQIV